MANQILTYNGYDMFEVVSALQKSIRRGLEEDAMYWGVEMYISGFIPYAWKRLKIMSMEDIGLANPMAPVVINNLHQLYVEMSAKEDKKHQERLPFVQAILYLVHSPKSRHTDWCQAYWFDYNVINGHCKKIPDYALDIHTRRGKMLGKTIEDFFKEGSQLGNHVPQQMEEFYRKECHDWWTSKGWCEKATEATARYNMWADGKQKVPKMEQKQLNLMDDLFPSE